LNKVTLFAVVFLPLSPLHAAKGFYGNAMIGVASIGGENVTYARLGANSAGQTLPQGSPLTTTSAGGPSFSIQTGYSILATIAPELKIAAHAVQLGDSANRVWSLHLLPGVRLFALGPWQRELPKWLRPFDLSLAVGFGKSVQAQPLPPENNAVGFDGFGLRYGMAIEYFAFRHVKFGLDYSMIRASYKTFIFNRNEGLTYPITPKARASHRQISFCLGLQLDRAL